MNIEEQVLSREQMAHLVELGFDTSDASMMWFRCDDGNAERWYLQINNDLSQCLVMIMKGTVGCFVPTYTIGDLIEKLPKEVDDNRLEICLSDKTIGYVHFGICAYHEDYDNLMDGLYNLLCWVAENHKELIK